MRWQCRSQQRPEQRHPQLSDRTERNQGRQVPGAWWTATERKTSHVPSHLLRVTNIPDIACCYPEGIIPTTSTPNFSFKLTCQEITVAMTIWMDRGQDGSWCGSLLEQVLKWFCTHTKQLHRYRNRYFFTQVCIQLLSKNETDNRDDADHKRTYVGLRYEVTHLHNSLEEEQNPKRNMNC